MPMPTDELTDEQLAIEEAYSTLEETLKYADTISLTKDDVHWLCNNYSEFITETNKSLAEASIDFINDYYAITRAYSRYRKLINKYQQ